MVKTLFTTLSLLVFVGSFSLPMADAQACGCSGVKEIDFTVSDGEVGDVQ